LRHKDRQEAKAWMAAAAKEFSPQLNKLFAESFYEVGWLPKPEGGTPAALEVTSPAERVARAQTDLARAERAYRQGDLEGAWQLLDQVDATAPNQAVAYNLRGEILLEQGKIDQAEVALRNALAADPQLVAAHYNLARVPFARKDYETARKELEQLLGAISGGKEERRELIRYQIYLTLLLEGREGAAQKAIDEFKMMDGSPALYYAQAAWSFQHGNPKQGKNWVANASNLYSAELNRAFAAPFSDLGWVNNAAASAASTTPMPVVVQNRQVKPEPTPTTTAPPVPPLASPPPAAAQTDAAKPAESPEPKPEVSVTPKKVASAEKQREKVDSPKATKKKRTTKKKSVNDDDAAGSRRKRTASAERAAAPAASPTVTLPPPAPATPPVLENLGAKVRNFFLYPFKRPLLTPTPAPAGTAVVPAASASPTPPAKRRPNN
jgi:tetratricopeptide (TPR) repeat protein